MAPDFELFEVLRRHGVPFVIIGGHAVNYHGFRRATEDTDVIWFRSPEAEQCLLRTLAEVNAKYIGKDIDPATGIERTYPVTLSFIQISHLMMLWTDHGFLDIFDYIPGFPTENPEQILSSSIDSGGYRFVSFDWLRQMKRAAGRAKDLTDLDNLPQD